MVWTESVIPTITLTVTTAVRKTMTSKQHFVPESMLRLRRLELSDLLDLDESG